MSRNSSLFFAGLAIPGAAPSFNQLPPQLLDINAVLGYLAGAEQDDRHVEIVPLAQDGVRIDVDFTEPGTGEEQQRSHFLFRFLAKMTSRPRVEGDIERSGNGKNAVLGAHVDLRLNFRRCAAHPIVEIVVGAGSGVPQATPRE